MSRTAHDVCCLIVNVASGALDIEAVGQTWDQVWAGNVEFACSDGTVFVAFNDCDNFDYIDTVSWPEGGTFGGDLPRMTEEDVRAADGSGCGRQGCGMQKAGPLFMLEFERRLKAAPLRQHAVVPHREPVVARAVETDKEERSVQPRSLSLGKGTL